MTWSSGLAPMPWSRTDRVREICLVRLDKTRPALLARAVVSAYDLDVALLE